MKISVPQFLFLLSQADAITVDGGPVLTGWETAEITGEPDNQVARFCWTDGEYEYDYKLTEEDIQKGRFNNEKTFVCSETLEDDTEIRFYNLIQISPSL